MPPFWLKLSMDTWIKLKLSVPDLILYDTKGRVVFVFEVCKKSCMWIKLKLSVPDLILYDTKGRVVFVFEVCKKSCIPYFALIIALHHS